MKKLAYIIVVSVALCAATATVWVLRNSIIERLSGPILGEFGLEIVDVSLDALATRDARIGYLKLRHSGGMTIAIEDLLLAVRETGGRRRYEAARVVLELGDAPTSKATSAAGLIRQALEIPNDLAGIDVTIAELIVGDLPGLEDVTWSVYEDRQTLRATLGEDHAELSLRRLSATEHSGALTLLPGGGPPQHVTANVAEGQDSVRIDVVADIELAAWHRLLTRHLLQAGEVATASGSAVVNLRIDVPDDPGAETRMAATVLPAPGTAFRYGEQLRLVIEQSADLHVSATLPGAGWSMKSDSAILRLTGINPSDLAITLTSISCQSSVVCSMHTALAMRGLDLASAQARSLDLSGHMEISLDAGDVDILLKQGARLAAGGVSVAGSRFDRIGAAVTSDASISIDRGGWRFDGRAIDAEIEKLDVAEVITGGALFLENTSVTGTDDQFAFQTGVYMPSLPVSLPSVELVLPGLQGSVSGDSRQVSAELSSVGLAENGAITATLDLEKGSGEVRMARLVNSFADRPLTGILVSSPPDFDLTAGTVAIDGTVNWQDDGLLQGAIAARFAGITGFYTTVAFAGISTDLDLLFDEFGQLAAAPSEVLVELVDVGVALRDISAQYLLSPMDSAVEVSDLQLAAFGGRVRVEPFSLRSSDSSHTLIVKVEELDLAELLTVQEFKAVVLTGRINGSFPITMGPDGIRIDGGRIVGMEPGGVIRYARGSSAEPVSAMDIATQALSNFEYDSLTSDVSYLENGDLVLKMQLRGRNPDMEGGRPIVLNLGVENNIPQMLRSLQASRSIEDILEGRVKR